MSGWAYLENIVTMAAMVGVVFIGFYFGVGFWGAVGLCVVMLTLFANMNRPASRQ